MSSYNLPRLAGLDAMVLHFSNSRQSTVDGIPYVTVSRTVKNGRSTRPSRTPLGDRTPEFNITPSAHLCKHTPSSTPKESRHNLLSRPKPCRASTSFHPLPLVPSSSSLQLPSFSNYNFYSSTPLPEPTTQPSAPSSPVLSSRHDGITLPFTSPQARETLDDDNHEYHIPAFQHPNSPYVPWAPPFRREILCPPTPDSRASFISSEYSRSYSRSGARAPEPVDPISDEPYTRVSNGWRSLGQALKKVGKRLANPFKAIASHISASATSGSRLRKRRVLRKKISRPPQTDVGMQTLAIQSPSLMSFDSSETTTLATWLAARRRLSLEGDYEPQSTMSLEEYERMGSWTRAESGIDSSCGVPECCMHPSIRDQATSTPRVSRQSITCPQSPQSRSFPRFGSPSPWYDEGIKREREMSMPGGWAG